MQEHLTIDGRLGKLKMSISLGNGDATFKGKLGDVTYTGAEIARFGKTATGATVT